MGEHLPLKPLRCAECGARLLHPRVGRPRKTCPGTCTWYRHIKARRELRRAVKGSADAP